MTAHSNTENLKKHAIFEPQNLKPRTPGSKNLRFQELSYDTSPHKKYGTLEKFSAIPMVRCNIVIHSQVGYKITPLSLSPLQIEIQEVRYKRVLPRTA
jgi:hypothetical protein